MDIAAVVDGIFALVWYATAAITLLTFCVFLGVRVGTRLGFLSDERDRGRIIEFLKSFR